MREMWKRVECCGFEFSVALTDALLRWKAGARGPASVEAMLHAWWTGIEGHCRLECATPPSAEHSPDGVRQSTAGWTLWGQAWGKCEAGGSGGGQGETGGGYGPARRAGKRNGGSPLWMKIEHERVVAVSI